MNPYIDENGHLVLPQHIVDEHNNYYKELKYKVNKEGLFEKVKEETK